MDTNTIVAQLCSDAKKLRAPQGYLRAGLPHFPGLFGRDSLIAGWQFLRADASYARAALRRLAALQGTRTRIEREEEPGKILHEYYEASQILARVRKRNVVFGWGSPYYGSVDATPLWLMVLRVYVAYTKDGALTRELWGHAVAAYRWITQVADHNGDMFLDYTSHNPKALEHQAWKDSRGLGDIFAPVAPVEVQGYAFAALGAFAAFAEERKENRLADDARNYAERLRETFHRRFRHDDFYAFAIDGNNEQAPWRTSNPGHLLMSGILSREQAQQVADRLFERDFWTPFGIRTLSMREKGFHWQSYHRGAVWPHDNWFFWRGLVSCGMLERAGRIRDALREAFRIFGGRIPECYTVSPDGTIVRDTYEENTSIVRSCSPQAWASGALFDMLVSDSV